MFLADARALAMQLQDEMALMCERFRVAGSIRRRVAQVKDIEIVCVPSVEVCTGKTGLFDDEITYEINRLHSWATNDQGFIEWIKPGTSEIETWTIKPDGKYWRGYWREWDLKVDIFLASERNFGAIELIRTGSAEFSEAVVTHAKRIGRPMKDGFFHIAGVEIETSTEQSVFDLLSLEFVRPEKRTGKYDLRAKRQMPQEATTR